ncbi:MAG: hypothetical protein KGI53_06145, partial [Nitrospirota bacterium]|nr:hypothetical protein [Nitrospirota bacterium]
MAQFHSLEGKGNYRENQPMVSRVAGTWISARSVFRLQPYHHQQPVPGHLPTGPGKAAHEDPLDILEVVDIRKPAEQFRRLPAPSSLFRMLEILDRRDLS